jgi:hypothetical protein
VVHEEIVDIAGPQSFLKVIDLYLKAHGNGTHQLVHSICRDIKAAGSLQEILKVLNMHASNIERDSMAVDGVNDPQSLTKFPDGRQVLLSNFNLAFQVDYKQRSKHGALNAFLDFLDVHWSGAWERWKPNKCQSQSLCGTIAQSSCTGKSRLVERYEII